jgi:hypothetical protein
MKFLTGIEPTPEYRFHPVRKWRIDYAFPDQKLAIEIVGGAFTRGRHTRGVGFINDMEKYNLAASMSILVFRIPSHDISTKWLSPIIKTINERTKK